MQARKPYELVIISGKGGTGKTSVTAAFASLARGRAVLADCDVDAADLHLVLPPEITRIEEFVSGREAIIDPAKCTGCGRCHELCRFDAIIRTAGDQGAALYAVDPLGCEGCGVCVRFCPARAIEFPECVCGEWMFSETRCGPMVHARLRAAAENSGKLVARVRQEAQGVARNRELGLIITDGPPGIGCPVIAAVTGASKLLVVTEPTLSGEHDLRRVLQLAQLFQIPVAVCVNKWDINRAMTDRIERCALEFGAACAGRVRYDNGVTAAMVAGKSVVERESPAGDDIRRMFETLELP